MQLTFPSHKQIELSFKVGIAGTSSQPQSVTVVLERNFVALSFIAKNVGDEWKAIIENPGKTFGDGEVKVSVNVILNNRLFVPMKGTGTITSDDTPVDVTIDLAPTADSNTEPAEPAVELQDDDVEYVPQPVAEQPEVVKVDAVKEIPVEKAKATKYGSLLKMHEMMRTETVKHVKPRVEKPLVKIPPKVQEQVAISAPIKMQLLKSIEPGTVPSRKIQESVIAKQPEVVFKLKRVKIIQQ